MTLGIVMLYVLGLATAYLIGYKQGGDYVMRMKRKNRND